VRAHGPLVGKIQSDPERGLAASLASSLKLQVWMHCWMHDAGLEASQRWNKVAGVQLCVCRTAVDAVTDKVWMWDSPHAVQCRVWCVYALLLARWMQIFA
jgi:hypothetical protein